MYSVYADFEANPSKDPECRLLRNPFGSVAAAWHWIKMNSIAGMYFEVVDQYGVLHPEPEAINFLLFAGDNHHPLGGYFDLIAKAVTEDELREIVKENEKKPCYGSNRFDWWQIVNANTHTIVDEGTCE